jgi:hypothetical protein
MVLFKYISLIALVVVKGEQTSPTTTTSVNEPQVLGFDRYAGYMPTTQITDIAAIDLDKLDFNVQLQELKVNYAMSVYTQGGHSGNYAVLKLNNLSNTEATYLAGSRVIGVASNLGSVTGTLMADVILTATTLEQHITVRYDTFDTQSTYVNCQVGGLFTFQMATLGGCKFFLPCRSCPHSQSPHSFTRDLRRLSLNFPTRLCRGGYGSFAYGR